MRFENLKSILRYIRRLKREPVEKNSVFNSFKKMLIFFILYVFITGVVAIIVIFSATEDNKIVTVPNVIGKPFYKGFQILDKIGLDVDIELRHYENTAPGIIKFQSIEPLRKVKEGRKILLIVSLGPKGREEKKAEIKKPIKSYVVKFKLPEIYKEADVRITIQDEYSEKEKTVFNQHITSETNVIFMINFRGKAIKRIYINDELYLEESI